MEKLYALNDVAGSRRALSAAVFAMLLTGIAGAQPPAGRWEATFTVQTLKVPVTMNFEGAGQSFTGSLVFGDFRLRSTSGSIEGEKVHLEFEKSGVRLEAKLADRMLEGTFGSTKGGMHPFIASAWCSCAVEGEAGPEITGAWKLPEPGSKLTVRRSGDDTLATLSRSGDELGPLSGRFNGVVFELAYFDGTRAAKLEIEPRKDGGLDLVWTEPGKAVKKMTATRE